MRKPLAVWMAWLYLSRRFIAKSSARNLCKGNTSGTGPHFAISRAEVFHGDSLHNCPDRGHFGRFDHARLERSTSAGTKSSTRGSTSRCSRASTSTSITTQKRKPPSAWRRGMAERWYTRLSQLFKHELSSRQKLILYAAHPHFQQTNTLEGEIGEGTGGVTESTKRRVILPFAGGLAETDHVLGHELVHAFQYDLAAQVDMQGRPIGPGLQALPLWFIEGMAEYLSIGPVDTNTAMWVREASFRNAMPTIDRLDDPDFFPVPLRPCVLGVRRRTLGRPRRRRDAAGDRPAGRHRGGGAIGARRRHQDADDRVARVDPPQLCRRVRDRAARRMRSASRSSAAQAAAAISTWRRRSAPTAAAWCSCRRNRCSRSTCTSPTPRPGRSRARSSRRPAIRISTACSS